MIKKADIVLAAILLIVGLGSPFLLHSDAGSSSRLVVTVDGETLGSFPLNEDRTIAYTEEGLKEVKGDLKGHTLPDGAEVLNLIVIEKGSVRIGYASCKGNDCVKMGTIKKEGQVIACLPHKMLITISGDETSPDVIIN